MHISWTQPDSGNDATVIDGYRITWTSADNNGMMEVTGDQLDATIKDLTSNTN